MKRLLVASVAICTMFSTSAFAGDTAVLTANIENTVTSANSKAERAQIAFNQKDARSGCVALVGAARDLDKSIALAIRLTDEIHDNKTLDEGTRMRLEDAARSRLQAIVNNRSEVQQQLETQCVISS